MIICKIHGGLGNQMFQYAMGRQLAKNNNSELKLDLSGYLNDKLRHFTLDVFLININVASKEDVALIKGRGISEKIRLLLKRLHINFFNEKIIFENSFNFDKRIADLKGNAYLCGYWQNEKYFKNIESIIRQEFSLKDSINKISNSKIYKDIHSDSSVSIHVRRSDYVLNKKTKKYHGTCSINYYLSAINIIKMRVKNPKFYIFSDDIEWCKEQFPRLLNAEYIINLEDYEDLILMSRCNHNIIANSSFSWWGAWLNTNPTKIVIAPQKWFNDRSINIKDLIPDSWIKI